MASEEARKLFISYTQADRAWAEWIAWHLEEAGHKTILQGWHFGVGANFVQEMHRALQEADRVVAVVSPAYEKSAFGSAEWQGAFVNDPTGDARKLVPVRVERYEPTGLLASIVCIDLVDIEEFAARERLLEGLRGPGKPDTAPPFPTRNKGPWYPGGASEEPKSGAEPVYENEKTQKLSGALKTAYRQRAELEGQGEARERQADFVRTTQSRLMRPMKDSQIRQSSSSTIVKTLTIAVLIGLVVVLMFIVLTIPTSPFRESIESTGYGTSIRQRSCSENPPETELETVDDYRQRTGAEIRRYIRDIQFGIDSLCKNHAELGLRYSRMGDNESAERHLRRSISECKMISNQANLAAALCRQGKYTTEADIYFEQAMEMAEKANDGYRYAEVIAQYADTCLRPRGKAKEGLDYLKSVDESAPVFAVFYGVRGSLHRLVPGHRLQALADYQRALKGDLENPIYRSSILHNYAITLRQIEGFDEQAESTFWEALALNPEQMETWNGLGEIWKDRGNYEEARKCYAKALVRAPENAALYYNLLTLCCKQQDCACAEKQSMASANMFLGYFPESKTTWTDLMLNDNDMAYCRENCLGFDATWPSTLLGLHSD